MVVVVCGMQGIQAVLEAPKNPPLLPALSSLETVYLKLETSPPFG
jgi:hypothetical protein